MSAPDDVRRVFGRFSASGIFFQGGAAAIDTGTIVATLVHGLTGGSAVAVGAAATIARAGWLLPQLIVGYVAQRRTRRMPFYVTGAFGRAICLAALAALLWVGAELTGPLVVAVFFIVWTIYAFVGGIVAVPYNDIVARSVPSERRSRLLAVRFFGGGLLALLVAAAAHQILVALPFHAGYAAVLLLGAILLLASALFFISAGRAGSPRQGVRHISELRHVPAGRRRGRPQRPTLPPVSVRAVARRRSRDGAALLRVAGDECRLRCRHPARRSDDRCLVVEPPVGLVGRPAWQDEPARHHGCSRICPANPDTRVDSYDRPLA